MTNADQRVSQKTAEPRTIHSLHRCEFQPVECIILNTLPRQQSNLINGHVSNVVHGLLLFTFIDSMTIRIRVGKYGDIFENIRYF